MIPTSDSYNPFPAFRRVGVALKFSVVDVDAKNTVADIATTSVLSTAIGNLRDTVDDNYSTPAKYATLEPDLWTLDGSFSIVPDDPGSALGWWSAELSSASGAYRVNSTYAQLTYSFSAPISTIGWSLYFDPELGEYPTGMAAQCYDADGTLMDTHKFVPTSSTCYVEHDVAEYSSVKFTFYYSLKPQRRIRLLEVDFGLTEVWDADKVGTVTLVAGCDPVANAFPARECTFTFDNSKKVFDLLDPQGIYTYLQDGQTINTHLVVGGESVFMGDFRFDDVSISATSVLTPTITGYDIVMRLDTQTCPTGDDGVVTLSQAVAWALDGVDVAIAYGDGVADRQVRKSIPAKTTKREALRMFAQAARCTIFSDRYGVIQIREPIIGDVLGELTANELYSWAGVSVSAKVDAVELNAEPLNPVDGVTYQYIAGSGESTSSFNNPCVPEAFGATVAEWLLGVCNWRKKFSVQNRCDPAMDILDTIRIHDIYGHMGASMITGYNIEYTGGLSATTEAVGQ